MFEPEIIKLNGKRILGVLSCSETEGWVEVIDEDVIEELNESLLEAKEVDMSPPQPAEVKTKKLYGKVEVQKVSFKD